MNALVSFALKHRVLMVVVFVMMMVGGVFAFRQLNIEAYPDPTPPMVDVITQSEGLSAEEIERYITIPIEAQTSNLKNLHTILAVRERFRDLVSIQIVAFPQSGVIRSPGTAELLDAAIAEGADLVGGLDPLGIDRDLDGHLDAIFGVASKRGVGIDIHLHDGG